MNEEFLDSVLNSRQIYNIKDSIPDNVISAVPDHVPDHLYLLGYWASWNAINDHISKGKYNFATKAASQTLVMYGAKSMFIKSLANGNLLFPEDVIETALEFEKLDNYLRSNMK